MSKINIKPEIKYLWTRNIEPDSRNPREIKDEALQGLHASLEQFGYAELIIVNKKNMQIVSGHQRFKVLSSAGVKRIPCVVVDVDDMEQQAMSITMNNQQIAGYFTAALIPILERLRNKIPNDYINLRLQELREEVNEFETEELGAGKTLPDDIPETPKKAITKKGDLWILGNHRLLCGSSTEEKDVARLMDGQKANLLATDPPYVIDYTGKNHLNGGKDWSEVYHETEIKDPGKFFRDFYSIGLKYTRKNVALYMWYSSSRRQLIEDLCVDIGVLWHQTIIWHKPVAVQSFSIYPWRHELCLFGWQKGHKPFFRKSQNKMGTVWVVGLIKMGDPTSPEYYTDIWDLGWQGKKRPPNLGHPTIKPTEVFAIPMRVHTKPGDICYEPFSGSGSQIIAGERMNRRVFAMELEPVFCDIAVKRWEEFTGKKAERGEV